ncbi:MAG: metallophosphoesterase family protein [Candidatus Dormibacteria bacterium]
MRFLHSSDWQLGMARAFMPAESRARYADDQIEAVRKLARIASDNACEFVVVAGDIFDSFQPDSRVIARAVDALAGFTVPVYLLPGNHDPDSPAALWSVGDTVDRLPPLVSLLRDSSPVSVPGTGAEVVGAPWPSRRPDADLVSEALRSLDPVGHGRFRIVVGHGAVDTRSPDPLNPSLISVAALESAIEEGRASYVALGDRHSATEVAERVWYSGAPVSTDYGEDPPNRALVVELQPDAISVTPVEVGAWHFLRKEFDLAGDSSVGLVASYLLDLPEKDRTVVRLALRGSINLSTNERLEQVKEEASHLLAALTVSEGRSDLLVLPDDTDLAQLDLSGFASAAVAELGDRAAGTDAAAETARDALMLLHRLAGRRP